MKAYYSHRRRCASLYKSDDIYDNITLYRKCMKSLCKMKKVYVDFLEGDGCIRIDDVLQNFHSSITTLQPDEIDILRVWADIYFYAIIFLGLDRFVHKDYFKEKKLMIQNREYRVYFPRLASSYQSCKYFFFDAADILEEGRSIRYSRDFAFVEPKVIHFNNFQLIHFDEYASVNEYGKQIEFVRKRKNNPDSEVYFSDWLNKEFKLSMRQFTDQIAMNHWANYTQLLEIENSYDNHVFDII